MQTRRNTLRKAAILMASLDEHAAEKLLRQMTAGQARLVREEMSKIETIDADEQRDVIEEFFRIGPLVPLKQPSGIDLDSRLARQLATSAKRLPNSEPLRGPAAQPFRFLDQAHNDDLTPFLTRERPQTIAVVVSHLPPNRAADVLAALPAELQAVVARRLVDLAEADPEVVRDVERGLQAWLSKHGRSQHRPTAGLSALTSILGAADERTKHDILANLQTHDRQLAKRLAPSPRPELNFTDVARLDDEALTAVLHSANAEVMILALAGASSELVERVLARLPPHEARTLSYALAHLGPTALSDMEQAQQELAKLATQMDRRGQLAQQPPRSFSLAV